MIFLFFKPSVALLEAELAQLDYQHNVADDDYVNDYNAMHKNKKVFSTEISPCECFQLLKAAAVVCWVSIEKAPPLRKVIK